MSIVLNEYEWAENAIKEKSLGKKPYETLSRLAKYYTYLKMNKSQIHKKLEEFLLTCDPTMSVMMWSDAIDNAIKYAKKYPIVMLDEVGVSNTEIEKINSLDGRQLRRLAFTLLCIAKYNYAVNEASDHWVNTSDSEIMKMANINTSIKRQSIMYGQLRDLGLIKFSKKIDSLSMQVLFADESEPMIHIRDFRNIGYQYMSSIESGYYVCQCCGITGKIKDIKHGSGRKYCPDCAVTIKTQQSVNSVMRL